MIKRKPYLLLFLVAILILIYSLITKGNILILNVKDTYYVISKIDFCTGVSTFLLFIGLIYWFIEKLKILLLMVLSIIHVIGTSILPVLIFYIDFEESIPFVERKDFLPMGCFGDNYEFYKFLIIIFFLMLQIIFIINIFVTLTKRLIKKKAL